MVALNAPVASVVAGIDGSPASKILFLLVSNQTRPDEDGKSVPVTVTIVPAGPPEGEAGKTVTADALFNVIKPRIKILAITGTAYIPLMLKLLDEYLT